MSILVIGDQDTALGFRLVGAKAEVVDSLEQARQSLEHTLGREDIELLLITREWAAQLRERIDRLKMASLRPIVMEIPGREMAPPEQSMSELVRRAIGISM